MKWESCDTDPHLTQVSDILNHKTNKFNNCIGNLLSISFMNNVYGKSFPVEDFRGLSISPVISKVLEHCILGRYGCFFETYDNQFGFKKSLVCRDAVYNKLYLPKSVAQVHIYNN